ncbi:IclR family transcriptional regulator [Halobacteriales archaeon QS_1_68_17]|nr:MAG: IclR family transcriptional regulator [Halobacteriales archaeon QS_1_68_17]
MNTRDRVKATATSFEVLEALIEADGAGVTECAERVDLSKSSAYSHLATLEELGYVVEEGGTYRVGMGFLDLGHRAREGNTLYRNAVPEIQKLAYASGLPSSVLVAERGVGIPLKTVPGNKTEEIVCETGVETPLHATAAGKAILAELDHEEVEGIADRQGLEQATPNTIDDTADLFDELRTIRDQGLAYDREEYREGFRGVGAAVTDPRDRVVGAVTVMGPVDLLSGKRFQQDIPGLIISTTNRIGNRVASP